MLCSFSLATWFVDEAMCSSNKHSSQTTLEVELCTQDDNSSLIASEHVASTDPFYRQVVDSE